MEDRPLFDHANLKSADDVDVSEDQPVVAWSVWAADSCSVVKAFIGANYLGVAYAFHLCGVAIAIPMFWLIAFASRQGCRLLIDCKIELDRRDREASAHGSYQSSQSSTSASSTASSSLSHSEPEGSAFAAVGRRLFGERMAHCVKAMLVLTQFGYCCGYFIFLSSTLRDLQWLPVTWSRAELVPLFAVPLSFIAMLPDISRLAPLNAFANLALLCGCFAVVACEFEAISDFRRSNGPSVPITSHSAHFWSDPSGIAVFFGMMVSALEGIGCIMPLRESISAAGHSGSNRFSFMLDQAIGSVALLLTGLGVLGVVAYGDNVQDIIIASLPKDSIALSILRACLIVGIFFTYPMQLIPVTESLTSYLLPDPAHESNYESSDDENTLLSSSTFSLNNDNKNLSHQSRQSALSLVQVVNSSSLSSSISSASSQTTRPVSSGLHVMPKCEYYSRYVLIRLLGVGLSALVAVFVPQFHFISSFTGCIGGVALSFILPAVFHFRAFDGTHSSPHPTENSSLMRHPSLSEPQAGIQSNTQGKHGDPRNFQTIITYSWPWFQNLFLIVFGVIGGVVGLYFNIKSLL